MQSCIFRSYDIRGIYGKDLDESTMKRIAEAFSECVSVRNIAVAHDMRMHSAKLKNAFISGLNNKNVCDCGMLPMGAAMFYAWHNNKELAYITASHLPKEWNGAKFFHKSGMGFAEKENYKIRDVFLKSKKKFNNNRISKDDNDLSLFKTEDKSNTAAVNSGPSKVTIISSKDIIEGYTNYLLSRIRIENRIKVVIDCGNGAAGVIARRLFSRAGISVSLVYESIDGSFPNRSPEPGEDNLIALKNNIRLTKSDMGIAYDGDADRMILVDDKCNIVAPEQAAYLILSELLKKEKGGIVANVECTQLIDKVAEKFGRKIIRIPVGHTFLAEAAHQNKAAFGIEPSGHYMLPSIVPYDDALAVSLYAAYALSKSSRKLSAIVKEIPKSYFERINFECSDMRKFSVIERLKERLGEEYKINAMDGIRIDMDYGFVLIRASNTSPIIRLTAESDTQKQLDELKEKFSKILKSEIKG